MSLPYVPHRKVLLRTQPEYSEKWVQQIVAEDPALLGLGELEVKDIERVQPRAGRLDMLLYDADTNTRFEVELQLGATNESHIIRTIEYWDLERRRYPQYEHVGVIVAEEITARFFNVISLFNGFIPLVALQMNAIEMNGSVTLVFTKVLDQMALGVEEEDELDEPRDRAYWEKKASVKTLATTDDLFQLVSELEPGLDLKYNKNYIGLARNGVAENFVSFRPRRQHVIGEFKIPRTEETTSALDDAGFELLAYSSRFGRYRIHLTEDDLELRRDKLVDLVREARDNYGS